MVVKASEENIVQALRRAHEERDVDLALSLYAEYAEIHVVDHDNPPNSLNVFRGRAQIAEYLKHLYNQEMTHHVGATLQDVISGEGRISFNVTSEYTDETMRLVAESYEAHSGEIV